MGQYLIARKTVRYIEILKFGLRQELDQHWVKTVITWARMGGKRKFRILRHKLSIDTSH